MEKYGYVYIMASGFNGTLYIGVTSNLVQRVYQHKQRIFEGFTAKYDVKTLVYFECCDDITSAIEREKKLKKYKRQYKINLIEQLNPKWNDLYETIC